MTMIEALREISQSERSIWARPKSWRGTGMALCFDRPHYWKLVPTPRGGQTASLPAPEDLFGEWEVVDPGVVNTELREFDVMIP